MSRESLAASLCAVAALAAGSASAVSHTEMMRAGARADLIDNRGRSVGEAVFHQGPDGVLVRLNVRGLTRGWHGAHFHAVGDCGDRRSFQRSGAHLNHDREPRPHGLLNPGGGDFGDLPNIHADGAGVARAEVFSTRVGLGPATRGQNLLDRDGSAIIIHAQVDDHTTQPIGGAGDRVVCGVIRAS